jgi:hypothetical protein
MAAKFEISKDHAGKFRFHLKAPNGTSPATRTRRGSPTRSPGRRIGHRSPDHHPCLQFDQGYANNGPVSAYVRSHNTAHKIRSQIAWAKNLNSAMRPSSPSPTTIRTEWSQSQPAPVSASSSAAAAEAFAASLAQVGGVDAVS